VVISCDGRTPEDIAADLLTEFRRAR
jgi:hypothetical protein